MYQIRMESKDGLFSTYLQDTYESYDEAKSWASYLSEQEQNEDYDFIVETVDLVQ